MLSLIIKPTYRCNLSCSYCYMKNCIDQPDMSVDLVKKLLSFAEESGHQKIRMIWHGGEPLLMGIPFYEQVFALADKSDVQVEHCFQSNVLLYNEDWHQLFSARKVVVSTSFDGPPEVHNVVRGNESHKKVLDTIQKFDLACIAVVSKCSLEYGSKRLLDYFNTLDVKVKFNAAFSAEEESQDGLTPQEWGEFMVELYEYWKNVDDFPLCDPITGFIEKFTSRTCSLCTFRENCRTHFLGVNPQGQLYACGRDQDGTCDALGSLTDSSYEQIREALERRKQQNAERVERLKATTCKECEVWETCYGGCPKNSSSDNINDFFCLSYKKLYSTIKHDLLCNQ